MPCRSIRASMSCLPRDNRPRSRRVSGTGGGGIGLEGLRFAGATDSGFRCHRRFTGRVGTWHESLPATSRAGPFFAAALLVSRRFPIIRALRRSTHDDDATAPANPIFEGANVSSWVAMSPMTMMAAVTLCVMATGPDFGLPPAAEWLLTTQLSPRPPEQPWPARPRGGSGWCRLLWGVLRSPASDSSAETVLRSLPTAGSPEAAWFCHVRRGQGCSEPGSQNAYCAADGPETRPASGPAPK